MRGLRAGGLRTIASAAALAAVAMAAGGCAGGGFLDPRKSFLDPTEMFPNVSSSLQKPILTSLSALDPSIDDPEDRFYGAQEIDTKLDNLVLSRDYKIGKGDIISVSISNLVEQNLETVRQNTVSESGNINLPLIGSPVKAEGLTEAELQHAVSDAYRNANILSNAQVSVQVLEARARSFNILGAVNTPSQYIILKSDFRVLDALVLAHDTLPSVDELYVIRQVKEDPNGASDSAPAAPAGGAVDRARADARRGPAGRAAQRRRTAGRPGDEPDADGRPAGDTGDGPGDLARHADPDAAGRARPRRARPGGGDAGAGGPVPVCRPGRPDGDADDPGAADRPAVGRAGVQHRDPPRGPDHGPAAGDRRVLHGRPRGPHGRLQPVGPQDHHQAGRHLGRHVRRAGHAGPDRDLPPDRGRPPRPWCTWTSTRSSPATSPTST